MSTTNPSPGQWYPPVGWEPWKPWTPPGNPVMDTSELMLAINNNAGALADQLRQLAGAIGERLDNLDRQLEELRLQVETLRLQVGALEQRFDDVDQALRLALDE